MIIVSINIERRQSLPSSGKVRKLNHGKMFIVRKTRSAHEQRSAISAFYARVSAGQWTFPLIDTIGQCTNGFGHCAPGSVHIFKPAQPLTRARLGYSIILRRVVSTPVFLPRRDSVRGRGNSKDPRGAYDEDTWQSGVKTSSLVIYFSVRRGVKVLKFH